MWNIKSIDEETFKKNYKKVKRLREKTSIHILIDTGKVRLLTEYNTDKDVMENDIVSVIRKGEKVYGIVRSIEKTILPYVYSDIIDAFYNSLDKDRVEYENASTDIIEDDKPIEYEEKFFEQIKSEYDDYKVFFFKNIYDISYDYQAHDNVLVRRNNYDRSPMFTKLKIRPGDLIIYHQTIGIITYVAEPKYKDQPIYDDYYKDYILFFRGDPEDKEGLRVLDKYISRRNTLTKTLLSDKFLRSENEIVLINEHEAKAKLFNNKEVTFKVCRSLEDMLNKIASYKKDLLSLLMDSDGNYRDSHFASEKVIEELKNNYNNDVDFDGSFNGLLKRLIHFVRLYGYTKETKDMDYSVRREFKEKLGYEEYRQRLMNDTHFEGVNLPKNFANKNTFCYNVPPFFINEERKGYWFSREQAYGLTIYNRASNPLKIKYYNHAEYNESYGYYSRGGDWDFENDVVESYAILCLNECPPVFLEKFYEENIIFELDGKFYAYYVFRKHCVSNYLNSNEIYNNPVTYYLSKDKDLYGLSHKIGSNLFDGAFKKDCVNLDDDQCAALYYSTEGDIDRIPEVNDRFLKDKTGIYSLDGKILYIAFNKNTRKYIVRDGVEEIRSYAFAYLDKVDTIIIPDSVKRVGRLSEPKSGVKPILCPKLKSVVVPKSIYFTDFVARCLCGTNISKKRLKEIEVLY